MQGYRRAYTQTSRPTEILTRVEEAQGVLEARGQERREGGPLLGRHAGCLGQVLGGGVVDVQVQVRHVEVTWRGERARK
jgi:hypothetical protein